MVTLTPKRADPPKSLRRSEQAFKKGGTASPIKRAAAGSGSLRRQVLVKSAEENKQSSHLIAASKVARDNGKTVKTGWGVFIANEGPRIKQKMPPGVRTSGQPAPTSVQSPGRLASASPHILLKLCVVSH